MRIISLDYGEKSLGVSISDPTNTIAIPLKNYFYPTERYQNPLEIVDHILKKYPEVNIIILGYPLNLSGKKTKITKLVDSFYNLLKDNFSQKKIILFDERFSTKRAKEQLLKKYSPKEQKNLKDLAASYLLLEMFLNNLPKNSDI